MKLLLTLFTLLFAFNATALSFTERMSAQNKPAVAQEAQTTSSLTAEDKALGEGYVPEVQDYSQLVQALLIIISLMATVIYFQNKKIQKLIAAAEAE
tara:strand:+ start:2871 stop:3161 length:291 start_codon:yes stop_codon:yes gene_type:complete